MVKSFISWVGGKAKLLWLLHRLFPPKIGRFIDVFGGSGTVILSRPVIPGTLEVYNDFNSQLVNLFYCVKNRPIALIEELGFLPLNSRDDFNALCKALEQTEFTQSYMAEEMALTERYFEAPEADAIHALLAEKASRGDVIQAANYYKLVRYSFSSNAKSFGGKSCDIRRFFGDIWACSRRLATVTIENKDCVELVQQYDRDDALIYCDPPYFEAEGFYAVCFSQSDHQRLHDALIKCHGYVMVSYNLCDFILDLYQDFFIFHTKRANSMSRHAGSEYDEIVMTNYDATQVKALGTQLSIFGEGGVEEGSYTLIHRPDKPLKELNII